MERIVYRISLDAHKNGIQRTLQGFETKDNIARRISVSLVAGGDTYEIAQEVTAAMYVTTPNASEPSIHSCTIENNTIIYDVLPIVEEGITEMQLKLIGTSMDGATSVLVSPRFAVEVCESSTGEDSAIQTTTFTALEDALAKAKAVHDARLLKIEIDTDCTFRAIYADGTVYENDALRDALYNGNALLSESFAHGGTGIRYGEETDNSKYYSNVSRSAAEDADRVYDEAQVMLDEARLQTSFTAFTVDFDTGELVYMSANYDFNINESTGNLEATNDASYDPETIVGNVVDEFVENKSKEIDGDISFLKETVGKHTQTLGDTSIADIADGTVTGILNELKNSLRYKRTLTSTDDCNLLFENGIYDYLNTSIPQNAPFTKPSVIMVFGSNSTTSEKIQLAYDCSSGLCKVKRLKRGILEPWMEFGVLIEDETYKGCYYRYVNGAINWENPPLETGVEYATTRRHNGKVVYAKHLDLGQLPASGNKNTAFVKTGKGGRVIDYQAYCTSGSTTYNVFPFFTAGGELRAKISFTDWNVVVNAITDSSGNTGECTVWYYKL